VKLLHCRRRRTTWVERSRTSTIVLVFRVLGKTASRDRGLRGWVRRPGSIWSKRNHPVGDRCWTGLESQVLLSNARRFSLHCGHIVRQLGAEVKTHVTATHPTQNRPVARRGGRFAITRTHAPAAPAPAGAASGGGWGAACASGQRKIQYPTGSWCKRGLCIVKPVCPACSRTVGKAKSGSTISTCAWHVGY
jgi:hypothetical protein